MVATKMTVYDVRRKNLTRLLTEKGAKTALAIKLECTQAHITHLLAEPGSRGAREIKEDTARQIELAIGLSPGELDREPGATERRRATPPNDPVLLEEAVRMVLAAAIEAHAKLASDKTAGIVRLVYEHSVLIGRVDPAYVAQLVKLMR